MDSESLVDLVLSDAPANEISDAIRNTLFAKSGERVIAGRPVVASDIFGDEMEYDYEEDELTQEDPIEEEDV